MENVSKRALWVLGPMIAFGAVAIATPFMGGLPGLVDEQGPLERGSGLLLLLSAVAFFVLFPWSRWLTAFPIPVALLLLAKREAEQDWWIVDGRLLTSRFYLDEGLTMTSVAGAIIALIVLASAAILLLRGLPLFVRALLKTRPWAVTLFAACAAGAIGQLAEEGAPLFAAVLGSDWAAILMEEGLEFLFAYLMFAAVIFGAQEAKA